MWQKKSHWKTVISPHHTTTTNALWSCGLPRWASIRRIINYSGFCKSRDDGDGTGIRWTICKSFAPCSRQITMSTPPYKFFLRAGCSSCHSATHHSTVDILLNCTVSTLSCVIWTEVNYQIWKNSNLFKHCLLPDVQEHRTKYTTTTIHQVVTHCIHLPISNWTWVTPKLFSFPICSNLNNSQNILILFW